MDAEERTRRWMRETIVGLGLRPLAAAPLAGDAVRFAVCSNAKRNPGRPYRG